MPCLALCLWSVKLLLGGTLWMCLVRLVPTLAAMRRVSLLFAVLLQHAKREKQALQASYSCLLTYTRGETQHILRSSLAQVSCRMIRTMCGSDQSGASSSRLQMMMSQGACSLAATIHGCDACAFALSMLGAILHSTSVVNVVLDQ